ncbi:MAG: transglutaminase-like cysteine peptidase [Neptuniibacter sp.]
MIGKVSRLFNLKLLHVSVCALLYLQNPAHASHLQKILPTPVFKKIQKQEDKATVERFKLWIELMNRAPLLSDQEKLSAVNQFFNKMKWVEDKELWGEKDYWATPVESLLKNAGDCEDYSIAKYFTLLEMGIPEDRLSISYVRFYNDSQTHMVLTYYPDAESDPLILDNMRSEILKISARDDIQPVFHLNGMGVWRENRPSEILGSAEEVDEWRKMMVRLKAEQHSEQPVTLLAGK